MTETRKTPFESALDLASKIASDRIALGKDRPAALRAAANFLLRRAADYDRSRDARCAPCDDSELLSRVAWVDARTREFQDWIEGDLESNWYCGSCGQALNDSEVLT